VRITPSPGSSTRRSARRSPASSAKSIGGFEGLIFSDDLSMAGASAIGGPPERAHAALAAGCDMVLLCNNPEGQKQLLDSLGDLQLKSAERLDRMRRKGGRDLRKSVAYREAQQALTALA
jgi:beta-N-acetylhexosaminidase